MRTGRIPPFPGTRGVSDQALGQALAEAPRQAVCQASGQALGKARVPGEESRVLLGGTRQTRQTRQKAQTARSPVVQRRPDVQLAGMLLRAGLECRGAPTVTFECNTRAWMHELKASFRFRAHAQRQCELDWPRMKVTDERSYMRRAVAYMQPSDLQVYFANQATFARPYAALVNTYCPGIVTQDSRSPPHLILRANGALRLDKTFLVWAVHADGEPSFPKFSVHAVIDVELLVSKVSFAPRLL